MSTPPVLSPDPGPSLDRLYGRLPDHYRAADAQQGYPLYSWLAGVMQIESAVETLMDRIDYVEPNDGGAAGDTSDLVDATTADFAWLPWIAQLFGVRLDPAFTDQQARDAITYASSGWRAGTKSAVADAAKSELTGTKYAKVYDHSVSRPGDGGQWDVLIVTRTTETPDVAAVLAAVTKRRAKPAGVVLHHVAYEASWDTVSATYPTWADLESAGSWDLIQEAGL